MVDEVVAGEGVDELALAPQVRGGDGDELAVAVVVALRDAGGRQQAVAVAARTAPRPPGSVTSSLVRDASTIAAIAASSPTTSWWISCSGCSGGMRVHRGG